MGAKKKDVARDVCSRVNIRIPKVKERCEIKSDRTKSQWANAEKLSSGPVAHVRSGTTEDYAERLLHIPDCDLINFPNLHEIDETYLQVKILFTFVLSSECLWDHCSEYFNSGGLVAGLLTEAEIAEVLEPYCNYLIRYGNGHAVYVDGAQGNMVFMSLQDCPWTKKWRKS